MVQPQVQLPPELTAGPGGGPVYVLSPNIQRQTGRSAQLSNIHAAKCVADIIRSTLGPRAMLKMLLSPMGGLAITNDGHCILREVDVSHPAAKSMIELSRSQDEEVGDGTTTVIILAGELLHLAEPFFTNLHYHPILVVKGYNLALQEALKVCHEMSRELDLTWEVNPKESNTQDNNKDNDKLRQLVQTCLSTKFSARWKDLMVKLALEAIQIVRKSPHVSNTSEPKDNKTTPKKNDSKKSVCTKLIGTEQTLTTPIALHRQQYSSTHQEVDIKRYCRIEKIPGASIDDCQVLRGVMFQKDITHSKMRRRIENPKILLLDCPLEYKKGESQTNVEITEEDDWNALLRMEEEYVENVCMEIIAFQPDIVITEKGVSDLAQHYLQKANITVFRRLRKSDNNRVARAVGATIVSRTDEISEDDLGVNCGLFEMRKVNDEWWCYLENCTNPKACTILLRGGSTDILNEIERNLGDAMEVIRNIVYQPKVVPGGGSIEIAIAVHLQRMSLSIHGLEQQPYQTVGQAMEVIPRTLAQNCGVSVIRVVTALRAKHVQYYETHKDTMDNMKDYEKHCPFGINGTSGELVNMEELGVWEPLNVKIQAIQTAIENACMIIRIDDIVAGSKSKKE